MIHIRKAISQDKPGELIAKGALREGRHDLVMVVLEDDCLIGCCSMEIEGMRGIINSLYITEGNRNQGIGDGLVRSILYSAQRQNIEWVEVPVTQEIRGLFERIGFKPAREDLKVLQLNLVGFFNACTCCGNDRCDKGC
jgi:N-acetylglutamate synthase-like GNAT family acetyltransferase